ncbi:MAG: hypothetical protein PVH68_12240 [Armatimonadota bacterium]|jgi:hypothetical protein
MLWHMRLVLFLPLAVLISRLRVDDRNREVLVLRQEGATRADRPSVISPIDFSAQVWPTHLIEHAAIL